MKSILLLSLLFVAWLACPARAQVSFDCSRATLLSATAASVPGGFLTGTKICLPVILPSSDRKWFKETHFLYGTAKYNKNLVGFFVTGPDEILVFSCPYSRAILLHEIGHAVWAYHCTKQEKDNWLKLWSSNAAWCTSYASTDPEEGFAESFRAYTGGAIIDDCALTPEIKKYFASINRK